MSSRIAADLYHAVNSNDYDRLANLLESGGDVDEFFEDSMNISSKSLLHICCEKDHVECLEVLINHGAMLDVRDKWGQTPLMYCITIQIPENAKLLLEASSDLCKCQDRYGKSSLHCAVEVGNIDLVRMLLQFGADVNLRDHNGTTPLMTSCFRPTQDEQLDIIQLLIEHGCLIDLCDYSGRRTALHAVEILVAAGADVSEIDKNLQTPLTHAIYAGVRNGEVKENYMTIIKRLVAAGADLDTKICESCNPLLASSQMKCAALMEFFLQHGADPNIKFPSGITAALMSTSVCDVPALRLLIKYNCDLTIQGSVYKRLYDREFVIDPFQMALLQGALDLCVLMILAGYPIARMWNTKECQSCLKLIAPDFNTEEEIDGYYIDQVSTQELLESKSKKSQLTWINAMSKKTKSLQFECICVIRGAMGQSVGVNASFLPLPTALRDFVCLKHVLGIVS